MIRALVAFALNNRFIVLSVAAAIFVWGIIAFERLPIEAYPDVANTWVQLITQWPGRAAEEVEQQITIPIEIQMNGIPHLQHVRSASLAGLSVVNLIFDDNSDNDWDRQKTLERLSMVTLPTNVSPQIGPDFSPIGSVYWYTVQSTNPNYDLMELKSLQDWVISKYIKAAPDVVDDSSFGGLTREYQVRVDPDKLVAYGLSLAQVEQQLTNSNANGGGSFIEQGAQQVNVRAVGLIRNVSDIEKTVLKTERGTAIKDQGYCCCHARREDSAWDKLGRPFIARTASWWTITTWSKASSSCGRAQKPPQPCTASTPPSKNLTTTYCLPE